MLSRDGSFAFQMAQSGNFRRLLPILGYMYHPNMLQTLGSNDWRERLFSQNSKQGFWTIHKFISVLTTDFEFNINYLIFQVW